MRWYVVMTFFSLGLIMLMVAPALSEDTLMSPDGAKPGAAMHNDEGVSHYSQGHWRVALGHFEEAVKADAKLAEAHFNLGLTLDKMGQHEEATAHFDKAAMLGPKHKQIQNSKILKDHLGK